MSDKSVLQDSRISFKRVFQESLSQECQTTFGRLAVAYICVCNRVRGLHLDLAAYLSGALSREFQNIFWAGKVVSMVLSVSQLRSLIPSSGPSVPRKNTGHHQLHPRCAAPSPRGSSGSVERLSHGLNGLGAALGARALEPTVSGGTRSWRLPCDARHGTKPGAMKTW